MSLLKQHCNEWVTFHRMLYPPCHSERSGTTVQRRTMKPPLPRSRTPKGRQQAESRYSRKALLPNAFPPPNKCEAARYKSLAPPNPPKNFPARQPPTSKRRKSFHTNPAVAVQGSSGRVREVWRGSGDFATQNLPVAALPRWTHLRKGVLSPPRSFSSPPHHSKQTAEADGDSAHVGNFVDFDLRVNATSGLQNGANLVGRYRVNTATERD